MALKLLNYVGQKSKLVLIGILVTILLIVLMFNASAIKQQLYIWKLLPEPEHVTELYFTHPNNLPISYVPGQSQVVNFTVHNLEYNTSTYTFKIYEVSSTSSQNKLLASGIFLLHQNQSKLSSINIVPVNLGSRVKGVSLNNVNEAIDYWVDRINT